MTVPRGTSYQPSGFSLVTASMEKKPRHESIRTKFMRKIRENKEANRLPIKGGFLGINYLREVLTEDEIRSLLREDFPIMDEETLEDWCLVIRDRRSKTYSILILEDMADSIDKLERHDHALDDEALYNQPFLDSTTYEFPWKPSDSSVAQILEKNQWLVPPRLSSKVHQRFPPKLFNFPFTQKPEMISSGSYGAVHEVNIAEGHLEPSEGFLPVRIKAQSSAM